jgi:hypothetical protein
MFFVFLIFLYFDLFFFKKTMLTSTQWEKLINNFKNNALKVECVEKKCLNFEFFWEDAKNAKNYAITSTIFFCILRIFRKTRGKIQFPISLQYLWQKVLYETLDSKLVKKKIWKVVDFSYQEKVNPFEIVRSEGLKAHYLVRES